MSTTLNSLRANRYSTVSPYQKNRLAGKPTTGQAQDHGDRVTLSSAAQASPRNGKKMALLGAIGTAAGVAACLLIPGAGLGGLILGGLVGGVAGAAIGDGALETAGTRPAKPFDPYNPSHVLDPDNLYHPQNPYNPFNFPAR